MATPIISNSFDSSDESVGSSTSRVVLFGTIPIIIPAEGSTIVPTIIPPTTQDDILVLSAEIPVIPPTALEARVNVVTSPVGVLDLIMYSSNDSDSSKGLSTPEHAPIIPATSPFLHSSDSSEAFDDSSSSDSFESLSSLDSHGVVVARWRGKVVSRSSSSSSSSSTYALPSTDIVSPTSHQIVPTPPGVPHRPAILVLPGQEISFGRPYRTHPNGVLRMLTARKRVHPFSARIPANYSPASTADDSPTPHKFVDPHPVRTPRDSEAYRQGFLATSSPKDSSEGSIEVGSEEDIDSGVIADIEANTAAEAQITGSADKTSACAFLSEYFPQQRQVCLYMHDYREPHFSALKRILRYVRGTLDHGLQLYSSSTSSLVAYSEADWVGCPTTRRLTLGYCVFLVNNLLSWYFKRKPTLSRSSAEAEYHGVANAVAETCWLRNLLRELHTPLSSATLVYCDNVGTVYLSSNSVQHQRTKHIKIDIHFVRDLVAVGQVRVLHVPSLYQYADIFTKGLPSALFEEFYTSLSVWCPPAQTAREC
ncbi:ribonuclease H-like domain-containing protein [Tanacetum coccineum]|uniref:Ribonuclease H-like domain-containing protein n=1 Tax=Tanacetum coccineum TaxID=301880 RepID=A0ABQ5AU90_9ASTR